MLASTPSACLIPVRTASSGPVRRFSAVALDAVEPEAEAAAAALRRDHPRAALPRRVVADVLVVPALQLGHPVPLLVPVVARDWTLHPAPPRPGPAAAPVAAYV